MKEPLHHYIKPGILHFMAYPVAEGSGPVLETLKKIISDEYFEVIEISWIKDAQTRKEAVTMLATAGVEVKYGAHPRLLSQQLDLNSSDESMRSRAVDEVKKGIDEAVSMGIEDVALLSGSDPGPARRAAAMDILERSLRELCAYGEASGTRIVLEVFDQSVDKCCLIGPAQDAREISARVKQEHDNFGLIVDLSHTPLLGESPADALRPVAQYLVHAHIGNCLLSDTSDPAYGDKHPRFGYPGSVNGVPEIIEYLKELFHIGYLKADRSSRASLSFEVKPVGAEDPDLVIANAKRYLNQAWSELEL